MLGNRKLVLDTFCEVYDLLEPWMDYDFWDFATHDVIPGAVYIISRKETFANVDKIRHIIENQLAVVVFSNPAEGSETLAGQCANARIHDLAMTQQMPIIGGGDMDARYACLQYDSFLPKILDYSENIAAAARHKEIYSKTLKPYKFLFLNGRTRPHRKYLLESFKLSGLLDQSLWTNLDTTDAHSQRLSLFHNGQDLMRDCMPIHQLPTEYEYEAYQAPLDPAAKNVSFVKNYLFKHTWGEIYLRAEPYIDTYFSVVTETVFDYPYSFRTEKIWKPIAMAHPFVVAANRGYYRDMHNLGFRTFDHVIDESFDLIDSSQDRIKRIADVVEDLCQQDLASFLKECYNTCEHNQQHLAEMSLKVREDFPVRFQQFITPHINAIRT
jgi:hypothetical protein